MWNLFRLLSCLATALFLTVCPSANDPMLEAASGSAGMHAAVSQAQLRLEKQYRLAWSLVNRNYMRRDRLAAWPALEHRYDGKLTSVPELETAVANMVASLGDEYTYVRSEGANTREAQKEEHDTVSFRVLPHEIGYLKINSFLSRHVTAETADAVGKLAHTRSIILDLRGNIGGGVDEAVEVFSVLSKQGRIASFKGWFDGSAFSEDVVLAPDALVTKYNGYVIQKPRMPYLLRGQPVIVLVDDNTRSAAELLAGALRDSGGAKIVGSRTFGKGVIQKTWDLPSGISIKLVIARYFLPCGSCIDGVGITPNYPVEQTGGDSQLKRAMVLLSG